MCCSTSRPRSPSRSPRPGRPRPTINPRDLCPELYAQKRGGWHNRCQLLCEACVHIIQVVPVAAATRLYTYWITLQYNVICMTGDSGRASRHCRSVCAGVLLRSRILHIMTCSVMYMTWCSYTALPGCTIMMYYTGWLTQVCIYLSRQEEVLSAGARYITV